MFSLIGRILGLAGEFSPAARNSLVAGMVFNIAKAFFAASMVGAVFVALANLDHLSMDVIAQCVGILLVGVVGRFFCQWLVDVTMDARGFDIFRDLRLRVGDQLKGAPMGYFSERRLSTITTTLTTTVHALEEFMVICMTGLSGGVAMALIMTVFFAFVAWPLALISLAGIAVGLLILTVLRKRAVKVTRDVMLAQEHMTDKVMEYTRGMAVLRTFSTPDEALQAAEETFEEKRVADFEQERAAAGLMKGYALTFNLASCVLLFATCALYLVGDLPLSWCLTLLVAAFMVYGELILVSDAAFLTKKIGNELDRVDEVCTIPDQDRTQDPLCPQGYDIDLDHVGFAYDRRPVLHDVSLSIPEGTTCAIVGPSGSGKTTLVNLIARFWDVDQGSVRIGGVDVREGTAESLLSHISMVFQNVYLFNDTIENNIRFGCPDAPHEDVVRAARAARCHDFITALPEGYDTIVGEGGASLSGGEKQRVSIARAIMKDAPLVILDEATSSVDPENEHDLIAAIDALTKDKTLITIAHRLNTVEAADQIIVIDGGRIVQRGRHEDLVAQEGVYRDFITLRREAAGWSLA